MEVPANRSRLDARLVTRLIIEQFPGLDVGDVRRFAVGCDHELFAVDDTVLFRFPLRAERVPWLRRETVIMPIVSEALGALVPRFA